MEINRNNYEAYFIDYLEGTLDEKLVDGFIAFIQSNPDLKQELALFESVSAIPENIPFNKKETLYKAKYDVQEEFDHAAVAYLEGDISKEEKREFELFLTKYPKKKKEAALFERTKLVANKSISFSKKNKLYRKSRGKVFLLWSGRVAAILIIAFAVFTLIDKPSTKIPAENIVAKVEDTKDARTTKTAPETNTGAVEQHKREPSNPVKANPEPAAKKAVPVQKENKSIGETTNGRMEHKAVTVVRIPIEIPAEIKAITASIEVQTPKVTMATMYLSYPDNYNDEEWLLADQVKEKFNLRTISKAGLDLVSSISNKNFSYQTDETGKVTEYKYDSRLLAFSVPTKRVQPE